MHNYIIVKILKFHIRIGGIQSKKQWILPQRCTLQTVY